MYDPEFAKQGMIEARAVVVGCGILSQPVLILIRLEKKFISRNFPLGAARLALSRCFLRLERVPGEAISLAVGANNLTHVSFLS